MKTNHDRAGRIRTTAKVIKEGGLLVINGKVQGIRPAPVIQVICKEKTGNYGKITGDDAGTGGCLPQQEGGADSAGSKHRQPVDKWHATVTDVETRCIRSVWQVPPPHEITIG